MKQLFALLFFAAALAAVTCAKAGTLVPPGQGGEVCQGSTCVEATPNGSVVNVYPDPSAASSAAARSSATGGAGGAASALGGSASVVVNQSGGDAGGSRNRSLRTVGVAPDLGSNNTAPCRIAVGAGGGWLGGALSIQGSVLDEGCDIWRDHENLSRAGFTGAAGARLCDKPEIARYLTHCAPQEPEQTAQAGWQH